MNKTDIMLETCRKLGIKCVDIKMEILTQEDFMGYPDHSGHISQEDLLSDQFGESNVKAEDIVYANASPRGILRAGNAINDAFKNKQNTNRDGCLCSWCQDFFPMAEMTNENTVNGEFKCYGCRSTNAIKSKKK